MEKETVSVIYKITSMKNNKIYVGSAANFYVRKSRHLSALRGNKHCNTPLQNSYNKYGEANLHFEIIEIVEDKAKLIAREQFWLDELKPFKKNGFNICRTAGNTLGYKHSRDTRKRMRAKARNKDYKMSEENRQKLREWCLSTGRKPPPTERGTKRSEATKRRMSLNNGRSRKVINLDTNVVFESITQAEEFYCLKKSHIYEVCRGKFSKCGGYRWAYVDN